MCDYIIILSIVRANSRDSLSTYFFAFFGVSLFLSLLFSVIISVMSQYENATARVITA